MLETPLISMETPNGKINQTLEIKQCCSDKFVSAWDYNFINVIRNHVSLIPVYQIRLHVPRDNIQKTINLCFLIASHRRDLYCVGLLAMMRYSKSVLLLLIPIAYAGAQTIATSKFTN